MSSPDGTAITYDVNELNIYDFFNYWPSLALAITALCLYAVAAVVIGFMTERRKVYRFVHCITLTGLLEASGYAALIYAIEKSGQSSIFNAYVAMQVLVVLSPNVIQAAMYWQVGLVLAFSPDLTRGRRILRGWVITTIFACADLFALTVQAIGISIWASSQASGTPDQGQIRLGCGITLGGLAIQLICFVLFTVLTAWAQRHPKNGLVGLPNTRRMYVGLYLAMAFLYIRNIFRFVEFAQATILEWPAPDTAYVLSEQQVLFYCLDTLPVLLVLTCYILFHPGYLLPPGGPSAARAAVAAAAAVAPAGAITATDLEAYSKAQQAQQAQLQDSPKDQEDLKMVTVDLHS